MTTVVELNGGLGNQLFQTALAYEMHARGHAVVLNATAIDPRRGLQVGSAAAALELPLVQVARRRDSRLTRFVTAERTIVESTTRFDPAVLSLSRRRNFRLRGYWQSECYFPTVADRIRSTYLDSCQSHLTDEGQRALTVARRPGTVSMHIRRGDYVTNPSAAVTHGVLPVDYYSRALELLGAEGEVLMFSDEIEWVESHFAGERFHPVRPELTTDASGELSLMAACSAHVIANSSFSWWGAWLGGVDHRVVAPERWFSSAAYDSRDIIPARWATI